MELTINQALQKAVEAHKAGKLQDAEAFYRAILQSQPNHADANHNLGVLAVYLDKAEAALPLFKIALKSNPNEAQFWISYFDALIKVRNFDAAKNLLEQGKIRGLAKDILDSLFERLLIESNHLAKPSYFELNSLLEYYKKGQHDLAQTLSTRLTQVYPQHSFGWKVQAVLLRQSGKLKESVVANKKVIEISPNDAEAYSNLGIAQKELGRIKDAEISCRKAIAIKPDLAEAHSNLGITLKELGRLEEAEISCKNAIAIKPDLVEAHCNLGITLKELGKLEEAAASYKKAIEIKPTLAEAHNNLGIIFQDISKLQDAELSYKKAIEINPNFAEAHSNLGNIFQEFGRLEKAQASYKKAIEVKKDYAEAHYNLGNTLRKLCRLLEAEASYKKAILIKPNLAEAHNNLGTTQKELGRLVDAEESFKKAILFKPDFAEAYSTLGSTLRELGRLLEAETNYKNAIAIKPDLAEAHSNLGVILKELGKLQGALASYEKAIEIKPDFAEAHNNLGSTLRELGRLEDAEISFKRAIANKQDLADAHCNLGGTLKELGRLEEAEASYALAISFKTDFIKAHNERLTCLYLMDEKVKFFDELNYLITQDKPNSVVGSLTCRSTLKYGEKKLNIFCNEPLEYVLPIDLKNRCNFEETFVKNVKSILNVDIRSKKRQTLLSNGDQTSGNLFDVENDLTVQIQKVIRSEIEKYRTNFKGSEEGLIRQWPTEFNLYGWLIRMKSGGELQPHIHENGWLSGSVYINVPPKKTKDSGNLVVALGKDSDATNSHQNSKKVIDVVTGSMVLFPASLMHHTIPFESEEERIVLAFDVVPK